jgi:hypothetical protein
LTPTFLTAARATPFTRKNTSDSSLAAAASNNPSRLNPESRNQSLLTLRNRGRSNSKNNSKMSSVSRGRSRLASKLGSAVGNALSRHSSYNFTRMDDKGDGIGSLNPHQVAIGVVVDNLRPLISESVLPRWRKIMKQCWHTNASKRPQIDEMVAELAVCKEEGLKRLELSLANASLYEKKVTVFAFKSKDRVIVYKSWGTGSSQKGDYIIVGIADDVYTCDAPIFHKTYMLDNTDKGGDPSQYRKTGKIFALKMAEDWLMETMEGRLRASIEYATIIVHRSAHTNKSHDDYVPATLQHYNTRHRRHGDG